MRTVREIEYELERVARVGKDRVQLKLCSKQVEIRLAENGAVCGIVSLDGKSPRTSVAVGRTAAAGGPLSNGIRHRD